jgi:hypothetical protein
MKRSGQFLSSHVVVSRAYATSIVLIMHVVSQFTHIITVFQIE